MTPRPGSGSLARALAALLLGLAWVDPKVMLTRQRYELFFVVDITQSMNTRDMALRQSGGARVEASRLAFTRAALARTLAALPCGSRVALGVFTEYRTLPLLAPLEVCAQHEALRATIDRIDGTLAWASASEVSRGVESALQVAARLPGRPALVFVSDGHESPPLRFGRLPTLEWPAPPLPGLLLGVGGDTPQRIPKLDPLGRVLGHWEADEVMQADPASLGRTVGGARQSLVDADGAPLEVDRSGGQEHLSALKEPHLRALAQSAGLRYARLRDAGDLDAALRGAALERPLSSPVSWRWLPALLALALIVGPLLRTWVRDLSARLRSTPR